MPKPKDRPPGADLLLAELFAFAKGKGLSLKKIAFVWAEDTTLSHGRSANSGGMESLGEDHARSGLRLVVDHSGCHSGAKWCLHDLLITTRPHDPNTFDLARDYTDFTGRPVQDGWIRALEGSLH